MATEECAICGERVPFGTTTHVLVNPKHEDGVADHYVCRPCYDEHLEGLFVALEGEDGEDPAAIDVGVDAADSADSSDVGDGTGRDIESGEEPVDTEPTE